MKKLLLISYILSSIFSFSQLSYGTKIGQTYYDVQSEGGQSSRIVRNNDGSISIVWNEHWDILTEDNEPKPNVRGFSYNHFTEQDNWLYNAYGECAITSYGCASKYVGFPNLINLRNPNSNNIQEMVFNHWPLNITERESIGIGNFSYTQDLNIDTIIPQNPEGLMFPKVVKSKNDVIHVIGYYGYTGGYNSVYRLLKYYRSTDGGVTWDIKNKTLLDSIGSGAYAIHCNENKIAITTGGLILNNWVLLNSIDGGDTWVKTIVKKYNDTVPDFIVNTVDGPADSYLVNMREFDVLIDDGGKTHVFCSSSIYTTQGIGGYFTGSDIYKEVNAGIMYWNSSKQPGEVEIIATPDYGLDGDTSTYSAHTSEYYGHWSAGWPAASFDSLGNIYLIYSAIAEDVGVDYVNPTTGDTLGYNDLYYTCSRDNGNTWGAVWYSPELNSNHYNENQIQLSANIAEDIYGIFGSTPIEDDVYPSTVKKIGDDGYLHFTWQGDYSRPGLALYDNSHPNDNLQYIHYGKIKVLEQPLSIQKNHISAFEIAPNPANKFVLISGDSELNSIEIFNATGQIILQITNINSKEQTVNVSEMQKGLYLIKIETVYGVTSKKLIIE